MNNLTVKVLRKTARFVEPAELLNHLKSRSFPPFFVKILLKMDRLEALTILRTLSKTRVLIEACYIMCDIVIPGEYRFQ